MPGLAFGYYENQINPDVYEPDKERRLGIESEYKAGNIDGPTAKRYMKALVEPLVPHEERLRHDRHYKDMWRAEANAENELQDAEDRQERTKVAKNKQNLENLIREKSAGITPTRKQDD